MVIDGEGNLIIVTLDSSLNTAGNFLTPGTVVIIKAALHIYFRYGGQNEKRCAIVVREFKVEGCYEPSPELMGPPKRCIRATTRKIRHKKNNGETQQLMEISKQTMHMQQRRMFKAWRDICDMRYGVYSCQPCSTCNCSKRVCGCDEKTGKNDT